MLWSMLLNLVDVLNIVFWSTHETSHVANFLKFVDWLIFYFWVDIWKKKFVGYVKLVSVDLL